MVHRNGQDDEDWQQRIHVEIKRLRPREQNILILSAAEKLPYSTIAERLGMTEKQVERGLADALCNLDRAFELGG
jgi:RNA polymerase sigma factor (sigma-70 family)